MRFLRGTWIIFTRHLRASMRNPVFLVIATVQPVLWLFLFGQLLQKVALLPGLGSDSYAQFLAPGIAIMAALYSASFAGLGLIQDINQGVIERFLGTSVSRGAILAGRLLDVAVQAMLQALILLLASLLVGARPKGGAAGVLLVLAAAALLAVSLASVSNGLALMARRQEAVIGIMNFIVLPMVFLSSMIVSHELMPSWIRVLSAANPVDWAVRVARVSFDGGTGSEIGRYLAQLAALALVSFALAVGSLKRFVRAI